VKREIIGKNSSRSNQEQVAKAACLAMNLEVLMKVRKENKGKQMRRK